MGTYLKVSQSYVEQFKAVRDNILIQISIIKNLIALGGIKIDAEVVQTLEQLNREASKSYQTQTVGLEEGVVKFGQISV